MEPIKLCMLAVLGVALTMTVKQWKADFLPLLRIGFVLLFGTLILSLASPLLAYIQALTNTEGVSEYAGILFKALGIAVLTEICANICRESGESGLASGVELTGKAEILLLSLPLLDHILSIAKELLEMGGGA